MKISLVMQISARWSCLVILVVCSLTMVGCDSRQKTSLPIVLNWTNSLNSDRPVIMTGPWYEAEKNWMDLKLSGTNLDSKEIHLWITLQVDILEKTQTDPLKDQIRIMAIQEIGNYPQEGRNHLTWLKDGLSTNLFKEPQVKQKAEYVLKKLD